MQKVQQRSCEAGRAAAAGNGNTWCHVCHTSYESAGCLLPQQQQQQQQQSMRMRISSFSATAAAAAVQLLLQLLLLLCCVARTTGL
jgi:hypothetical protein